MAQDNPVTYEELTDLADQDNSRLSAEQRASLLARVQADPTATAELARLRTLIHLMHSDTAEDAPGWVMNRAVRLFRQRDAQGSQNVSALQQLSQVARRIVALLQFDSAQSPLTYGVRSGVHSGDASSSRQLLFGADERVVDVRIEAAGSHWQVSGQVLGTDDDVQGGTVALRNETRELEAPLNDLSEFTLPPAPAGVYELQLRLGDIEVVIPNLEVGARDTL